MSYNIFVKLRHLPSDTVTSGTITPAPIESLDMAKDEVNRLQACYGNLSYLVLFSGADEVLIPGDLLKNMTFSTRIQEA